MTQTAALFEGLTPPASFDAEDVIEDLGEGLVLRHANPDDCDALAEFNRVVHANPPDYQPIDGIAAWTRDLMSGHPRVRPRDFVLVHDTKAERVASTLMLVSHRFRYGQVEFEAGQPEIVGTHPDYRRRSLVRRMFDVVHGWSAERGQKLLVIGGIPWYYRQFGYEMAIEHGVEYRAPASVLPARPPESEDALRVRPATTGDIALLGALYERTCERHRISCLRDKRQWRYELEGHSAASDPHRVLGVVEQPDGTPVAAYAHLGALRGGQLQVQFFDVVEGTPRQAITRPFFAELRQRGNEYAGRDGQSFEGVAFFLGREHPLYELARGRVEPHPGSYALYVRVPDLVDFLGHIAPELERRLAASPFAGQRGALDLNLYRSGVRIVFDQGRISKVEAWEPDTSARGHLAFPDLTFLNLLMGSRSLAELDAFYADCIVAHQQRGALAEVLFPKQPSNLWFTF